MKPINQSFCPYPFVQTVIRTTGMITPCCNMNTLVNIEDTDVGEHWMSPDMIQIRNSMLQGTPVPACHRCQESEKRTGQSLRTQSFESYDVNTVAGRQSITEPRKFPNRLEIHLGNLCNLKCLTCGPKDSSLFAVEEQQLKIIDLFETTAITAVSEQKILELMEQSLEHDISLLDVRGGEVTIMPLAKKILQEYPEDRCAKISLRVQTNGQRLDDDWRQIWSKFKHVYISVSVDAYGEANDYVRFPSQWSVINDNIDAMKSIPNVSVLIACVVSNLNFLGLADLIEWVVSKRLPFAFNHLHWPSYFQHTNLPPELFALAQQRLKPYEKQFPTLAQAQADPVEWRRFCEVIDQRDAFRRNRIFDIYPEFKPFWTAA